MKPYADNNIKAYSHEIALLQTKTISTALATRAIAPLQLPEDNQDNETDALLVQAQRINQMAAQLEAMILEFKTTASKLQEKGKPYKSICEYLPVSVPWVIQKQDQSFILTMQKVDIFKAERQAAQLAQQLRQHSKIKEERSH
ncbi:hypothetical protein H6G33_29605 [Calothrix sp. FACHB-1219]|uniref:hypothetical protein n=1 Tax=unclassified Calothrix TaxID=2619626 RepID=UPI000B61986E|nr:MULTISPECIES: hypothetical protein [unclassified Calothrix]MBD2206353.1 hypothetical protein [Calothrix sp. FACHB-168]MBD2221135.1 hypothetical protein [Calothrix sp. FACHB-1219]BAY60420.1 hypothetical protein NIES22_04790 [Calothrix brevissima NIES-22]